MPERAAIVRKRRQLSRERVLEAAIRIADAGGIDALSMRRLAQELGVEAMSLYHYFQGKDELLGAMLADAFAEMGRPRDTADWQKDMRQAAIAAKDVLLRHKWAARLVGEPLAPAHAQIEWMDGILGRLRRAGFSPNLTHHAYHALDSHIVGFVLWVLPILELGEAVPGLAQAVVAELQDGQAPYFLEHVHEHLDEQPDDVNEFEFGLDLILDGLERMRAATS